MAYLQARSKIARSKVTYSGWTPPRPRAVLNGATVSTGPLLDGFTITKTLDSPATCVFYASADRGFVPVRGNDLKLLYATPDDYLFAGTILTTRAKVSQETVLYECRCADYSWLIDQYAVVLNQYRGVGVSSIVNDLLKNFTDPASKFLPGYIPQSLGNIDIDFTNEPMTTCLGRIAKAVGAYFRIDERKQVSIFKTLADSNAQSFDNNTAGTSAFDVWFSDDISQIRNKCFVEGDGSTVTSDVATTSTTVPLADVRLFKAADGGGTGFARAGQQIFNYTGRSTTAGPGNLTGVTGLLYPISNNDRVVVVAKVTQDPAPLAAILGGGVSGVAVHYIADPKMTYDEANQRATAETTTLFGSSVGTFEYKTSNRWALPGQLITVNITSPFVVNQTFKLQSITITPRGPMTDTNMELWRQVQASTYITSVLSLLKSATEAAPAMVIR